MFTEERTESMFSWDHLGDVREGRPNLGKMMYVSVYRLMQFTLRDVLIRELGVEKADDIFFKSGEVAGRHFYRNVITRKETFNDFIVDLQESLKNLNIGILRVESADLQKLRLTLTVAEDLDCSGLPVCSEQICTYDEGFITGLLNEHTGMSFEVKEVDCWCSGDRVCRFEARLADAE
jgi:predicted hydrocarbon binding protein